MKNGGARGYHHGDLRRALIDEAHQAIERAGYVRLSLRACARAVGVDAAACYRHFRSKDKLLAAVAARGFDALGLQMASEMTGAEGGAQFLGAGLACLRFGLAHPRLYTLMFSGQCTVDAIRAERDAGPDPYTLLANSLDALLAAGRIAPHRRMGAELTAWSMVHGLVSLTNQGRGEAADVMLAGAPTRLKVLLDGLADRT